MESRQVQPVPTIEELVPRAARRDADAFCALIARFEKMALSIAFSILGDADLAGDVTQEAFVRAWTRLSELKEPTRFGTWLCGIARNLAIDLKRRRRHEGSSLDAGQIDPESLARWGRDPLEQVEFRETHEQIDAALAALDEMTREAVILRYYDGLSSKEIGEILGLSPSAVDMRLSRARQQLRGLLALVTVTAPARRLANHDPRGKA